MRCGCWVPVCSAPRLNPSLSAAWGTAINMSDVPTTSLSPSPQARRAHRVHCLDNDTMLACGFKEERRAQSYCSQTARVPTYRQQHWMGTCSAVLIGQFRLSVSLGRTRIVCLATRIMKVVCCARDLQNAVFPIWAQIDQDRDFLKSEKYYLLK